MGLSDNLKGLMTSVAANDLKKARGYVKRIVEGETAVGNRPFCTSILNQLSASAASLIELPSSISSLLVAEDVSVSFNESRYFLREADKVVCDELFKARDVNVKLEELGVRRLNSVLLHGMSGVGKTTFCRYLAYKLGLPFLYVNLAYCVDSHLGATGRNIAKVFDYASKCQCLLLLDEVDAIALARGTYREVGEMSRVVIALMQGLDSLSNSCVLLAATNRFDMIDFALISRFTFIHKMSCLSADESYLFLEKYISSLSIEYSRSDILTYVDSLDETLSHRELERVVVTALIRHLSEGCAFSLMQGRN